MKNINVRIAIVGAPGSGKTSLITCFKNSKFLTHKYLPTIGVETSEFKIKFADASIETSIWDIAGQKNFGNIASDFYSQASAVIIVYDLTRESTRQRASIWFNAVMQKHPEAYIVLVGNKKDAANSYSIDSAVSFMSGLEEKGIHYHIVVSAKTGDGVDQLFMDTIYNSVKHIIKRQKNVKPVQKLSILVRN